MTVLLSFSALSLAVLVAGSACSGEGGGARVDAGPELPDAQVGWARHQDLPEPVANNAVAAVELEGDCLVLSALGIDQSLEREGVHGKSFLWRESTGEWRSLPNAPGMPRLAASAASLAGQVYLLGGYTVEAGGGEVSQSELWRFDPESESWTAMADALVPVDDTVLLPYEGRYLIAVSGWSNTGNVRTVQIYDADQDLWHMGEDFPGTPVFGHAAAISGNQLLLIDGVRSGALGFDMVKQSWRAELDDSSPPSLSWTEIAERPGLARYRAAAGEAPDGSLWFHGGTAEPYNFDGRRYDNGQPATPLATTLRFDLGTAAFDEATEEKPTATMDHRGLVRCKERVFSVGGLEAGPSASAALWSFAP